jgi:hypothetical protein
MSIKYNESVRNISMQESLTHESTKEYLDSYHGVEKEAFVIVQHPFLKAFLVHQVYRHAKLLRLWNGTLQAFLVQQLVYRRAKLRTV